MVDLMSSSGGSRGGGAFRAMAPPKARLPPPQKKDPSFHIMPMAVHGKKGAISAICPPPKKKRPAGSANAPGRVRDKNTNLETLRCVPDVNAEIEARRRIMLFQELAN